MKKYEYKTLYLANGDNEEERINEYGEKGWRVLDVAYSDGGNILTVFLEKELYVVAEATKKALSDYQK